MRPRSAGGRIKRGSETGNSRKDRNGESEGTGTGVDASLDGTPEYRAQQGRILLSRAGRLLGREQDRGGLGRPKPVYLLEGGANCEDRVHREVAELMTEAEEYVRGRYPEADTVLYSSTYEPHSWSFGGNCLLVHTELQEMRWFRVIAGKWILSEPCRGREQAWGEAAKWLRYLATLTPEQQHDLALSQPMRLEQS